MINVRDKKYLKDFGKNLRKLRLAQSLTQEDLNHKADLGKNQTGLIERGEINISICTLKALAKALAVKPKDLLDF